MLFLYSQSYSNCRQIFFLLDQKSFVVLCIGCIVYVIFFFSHQIWMFVTLVHVKILELATILEQGGLCACVLQFSEESHVKVRASDREVDIF